MVRSCTTQLQRDERVRSHTHASTGASYVLLEHVSVHTTAEVNQVEFQPSEEQVQVSPVHHLHSHTDHRTHGLPHSYPRYLDEYVGAQVDEPLVHEDTQPQPPHLPVPPDERAVGSPIVLLQNSPIVHQQDEHEDQAVRSLTSSRELKATVDELDPLNPVSWVMIM